MKKQKGFSLIELIITISIIALLASIIAPSFLDYQKEVRLEFSRDLIETSLSKAFSDARSQSKIFGVKANGGDEEYQSFECKYTVNVQGEAQKCSPASQDYESNIHPIEKGVAVKGSFDIQFFPPHGDTPKNMISTEISIINTGNSQTIKKLKIHPQSGLIEKVFK